MRTYIILLRPLTSDCGRLCLKECEFGGMSAEDSLEFLCGADETCQPGTTGYECGESYATDTTLRSKCGGHPVKYTQSLV